MLGVDLVGDEALPEDPRHGPEERAGVGPERARLDERDGRPAAEVRRQSTASLTAHRRSAARPCGSATAPRRPPVEVAVEGRRGRLRLALVLRAELGRAVRPLDRARHLEEADLADPHPEVERDRQVGDVRQLERQVALPARIDVAGGRVDEQPEPAQRALALEPGDEVVRQLDPFERLAEHELAGVEDERLVVRDP